MVERILGVDPGLNVTGYGVLDITDSGPQICEAGVIRGGASSVGLGHRLNEIHAGLCDVIRSYSPQAIAIEELYSHYARPRTAILMGHARGVICLAAQQHQVNTHSYAATQIKRVLTGSGRAPKAQVQAAIRREFKLPGPPEPADVADALAIALCHFYLSRNAAGV